MKKHVTVTVAYADDNKDEISVPTELVSEFLHGLIPEAARLRTRDRARKITIKI